MRSLTRKLGDRLLAAVVPQATASACIPTEYWTEHKSPAVCRHCHNDCTGKSYCDAWACYIDC
ncbi:hypothetical protein Athai_09640 [Actinocatenispora thailandica]|uniref:Uncharacterized protein n=1 Tax=Actinocatenispora thailandica TaxID=227318 RepID=A0A7R7DKW9_9ACTN|nr:hypothetical protein [Actinocatenispora thailandica]BCJ33461.1 hypothetical protein Athai_09640 [Actinocatenispora thailandica]